jgi:hypothetical protein
MISSSSQDLVGIGLSLTLGGEEAPMTLALDLSRIYPPRFFSTGINSLFDIWSAHLRHLDVTQDRNILK